MDARHPLHRFHTGTVLDEWADKPVLFVPTPIFRSGVINMWTEGASCLAHMNNIAIRCFNGIYVQAQYVKEEHKKELIEHTRVWIVLVEKHLVQEKERVFEEIETFLDDKTVFEDSRARFKDHLLGPLLDLKAWVLFILESTDANKYHDQDFMDALEPLIDPLFGVYDFEVQYLSLLHMHHNANGDETKAKTQLRKTMKKWLEEAMANGRAREETFPLILNYDCTMEGGMWKGYKPVPCNIRWLVKDVARWQDIGGWRHNTCDVFGHPVFLHAVMHRFIDEQQRIEAEEAAAASSTTTSTAPTTTSTTTTSST